MRIAFTHNLKRQDDEAQAEFDTLETITALADALSSLGHDVHPVDVAGSPGALCARLEVLRPDLIFNTAEGSRGRYREAFYPALFEQLGLPYTGPDAWTCALTLDKALTKSVARRHGVPTPSWAALDAHRRRPLEGYEPVFPVIVKPAYEGSSKGVDARCVVHDRLALDALLEEMLGRYPDGVIVESFVEGVDITVPWLEGAALDTGGVLPAAGYAFAEGAPIHPEYRIYDYTLKNDYSDMVSVEAPASISPQTAKALQIYTARLVKALGCRGMARADFRVGPDGAAHFIELNALPSLEPGASLYTCAELVGLASTEDVLGHIVSTAARRFGLPPEAKRPARSRAARGEGYVVGLTYNLKRVDPKGGDDAEAEFDAPTTVQAIADALGALGHEVRLLEATPAILTSLPQSEVQVVFNIAEGIRGTSREAQIPALLDLVGIPYTGSEPGPLAVTLDKALARRVVREAGFQVAAGGLMLDPEGALPKGLSFPAVVKPNGEGSSKGISAASVVADEAALRAQVKILCQRYRGGALVEAFLPGREFTVGVLQGKTLAPMEIVFGDEAGPNPVYSHGHKIETEGGVRYQAPAQIDGALDAAIRALALGAFEALGCRDVGRVDVRLDAEGRPCFIECNPLPGLTPGWSDLCLIAESEGLGYTDLIAGILAPAVARLEAERAANALEIS